MKNAKHGENLKAVVKRALKEGKAAEPEQMDPLRAIVRAVLSHDVSERRADEAMAVVDREFCELNELRVATELELQDMLGAKYPDVARRAMRLIAILNGVFDREHTLTFERIKTLGKKEMRQFLRELPEMTPYVEGYAMLHGFGGAAVPVDDALMAFLVSSGAAEEGTPLDEVQRSLEHAVKVDEQAAFHAGVRKLFGSAGTGAGGVAGAGAKKKVRK